MEEAMVHAVDGLVGVPELIFVLGLLVIIASAAIAIFRVYLPAKNEIEKKRLDNEAEQFNAQMVFNRERENRKREESKERYERDKENAAIMARSVDAQERSNVVMSEATSQLAILNAKLDMSQERSAGMGETVEDMKDMVHDVAVEVHDLHKEKFGH